MFTEYQQPTMTKTIIVQDENSDKIRVATVELTAAHQHIDLTHVLRTLIGSMQGKIIKAYDFQHDSYAQISPQQCTVPVSFLNYQESNIFMVKVKNQHTPSVCSTNSIASSLEFNQIRSNTSSIKRQRSKQRIIFEVIEIVKKWRQIHLSKNNLRKVSLQDAARMVGLPKKSLDDYYYQLRLGEKYDFDFRTHLFDRIGVLRTFLKNLKQNSKLDKTQKHPKKLKIIDEFDHLSQLYSAERARVEYNPNYVDDMQGEQIIMKMQQQGQRSQQDIQRDDVSLHDQFYNQFQYMLNDKDPFLACDFNFKKKNLEENSSDQLFF